MFPRRPSWLLLVCIVGWPVGCDDAGSASVVDRSHPPGASLPAGGTIRDQPSGKKSPTGTDRRWVSVPDFDREIAVFHHVFWEPADTDSLRTLIRQSRITEGKTVLEIGTGSGLISLCCLQAGAQRVVATDINPAAVANARFNAMWLGVADRLDVRQVPRDDAGAYSVIGPTERFDLIISNPPWEISQRPPVRIADYAQFDPNFELMRTMLAGHQLHLRPGGKLLLVYGCVSAIKVLQETAGQAGLTITILDDRSLDELPEHFLPGMLLEVTP